MSRPKKRRNSKIKFAALLIAAAAALALHYIPNAWTFIKQYLPFADEPRQTTVADGDMSVHFLDVGQGDCTLIIMPDGEAMLIDTSTSDQADEIIEYISSYDIKKLDYLILTHPHADHIGSAKKIVERFEIGNILMPDATTDTSVFENLLNIIEKEDIPLTVPKPKEEFMLGTARITVLGPVEEYSDLNDMSLVMRLDYGSTSFLFTGDSEIPSEEDMLSYHDSSEFKSDVLKLGHHGSSTSCSKQWLDAVCPTYAVASCGKDNEYGHPHKEIISEMSKRNIKLLRTDEDGNIVFSSDGKTIKLLRPNE